MWIWPAFRGQNVPNSVASVSLEATFDAPSGLFRQFQGEVRRILIPRNLVNSDVGLAQRAPLGGIMARVERVETRRVRRAGKGVRICPAT
jgi:hypothetical protein